MFAIYDFDRFSKHDQIGQVQIPLNSVDLCSVLEEWRDVTSPDNDSEKVRSPPFYLPESFINRAFFNAINLSITIFVILRSIASRFSTMS